MTDATIATVRENTANGVRYINIPKEFECQAGDKVVIKRIDVAAL